MIRILRSVLRLSFLPLHLVGLLLVPYISIWPFGEIVMIIFPESTPVLSPFFEDLKWTLRVFAYFAAAYTVAEVWFQVWEKPDTHRRGVLHIFEWPQSVSNPPSNRTTMRRPKYLRQFVHGFYLKFLRKRQNIKAAFDFPQTPPEIRNFIYKYIILEFSETRQIVERDDQSQECSVLTTFKAFRRNKILYQELLGMYFSTSVLQISMQNMGILEDQAIFKHELLRDLRIELPYLVQRLAHGCYAPRPYYHFPFNHLSNMTNLPGPCSLCKNIQTKLNRFELLLIGPESNIPFATNLRTLGFDVLYAPDSAQDLERIMEACIQKFRKLETISMRIEFRNDEELWHGRRTRLLHDFLGVKATCLEFLRPYGSTIWKAQWSWNVKDRVKWRSAEKGHRIT